MATRGTGWGVLMSASAQETADLAAIASCRQRSEPAAVPCMCLDGFRTSHEI